MPDLRRAATLVALVLAAACAGQGAPIDAGADAGPCVSCAGHLDAPGLPTCAGASTAFWTLLGDCLCQDPCVAYCTVSVS